MNLQHLRYAAEVDRTGSISQAAENLYMGQPNLSKAIKELEASLGIKLFKRTTKGVVTTPDGMEFLLAAKKILTDMEELSARYRPEEQGGESFRLSVPRNSYIAQAFTAFVAQLPQDLQVSMEYCETNAMQAIQNILEEGYQLGVIRYQLSCEPHFLKLLREHQLVSRELWSFRRMPLFSVNHPLAVKDRLTPEDLAPCVELYHGDCGVHQPGRCECIKADSGGLRIGIYDRGSQFDLLSRIPGAYLWAAPLSQEVLQQHGLAQRPCGGESRCGKDVLIYPAGHNFGSLESAFIRHLEQAVEEIH